VPTRWGESVFQVAPVAVAVAIGVSKRPPGPLSDGVDRFERFALAGDPYHRQQADDLLVDATRQVLDVAVSRHPVGAVLGGAVAHPVSVHHRRVPALGLRVERYRADPDLGGRCLGAEGEVLREVGARRVELCARGQ